MSQTGRKPRACGRLLGSLWLAFGTMLGLASAGTLGCAPSSPDSPTVAIVNGRPITQSELDYRWSELPSPTRIRYESHGGKRRFLDDLISRELLLQEARRLGLEYRPGFREHLARVKEQALLDELMKEIVQTRVVITDEELDAYYRSHQASFVAARQIRAAHILVPTASQARDLKRQVDQGADFAKLAQRYSVDDTTKIRGGEFGPYRPGMIASELEPYLLTLKPGTVSEPIQSEAGYHLLKVISREPEDGQSAETVRQRLKQELYAEKRHQMFEQFLAKLRASATIRIADASGLGGQEAGAASDLHP